MKGFCLGSYHRDQETVHGRAQACPVCGRVFQPDRGRLPRHIGLVPRVLIPTPLIQRGVDVITNLAVADIAADPKRFAKDRSAIDAALVWLGVLRPDPDDVLP